jgi:hypothetical protein
MAHFHAVSADMNGLGKVVDKLPIIMHDRLLHYSEGKESPRPVEYKYGSNGPKESQEFEEKLGFVQTKDA